MTEKAKLDAITAALPADTAEEFLEHLEAEGYSVEPIPRITVNLVHQAPQVRYVPAPDPRMPMRSDERHP